MFYVYILANSERNVFYIGVTGMFHDRILDHKTLKTKCLNCWHYCTRLVYHKSFKNIADAADWVDFLEYKLAGWQTDFIGRFNPCWVDLSGDWFDVKELEEKYSGDSRGKKSGLLADFGPALPPTIRLFE